MRDQRPGLVVNIPFIAAGPAILYPFVECQDTASVTWAQAHQVSTYYPSHISEPRKTFHIWPILILSNGTIKTFYCSELPCSLSPYHIFT